MTVHPFPHERHHCSLCSHSVGGGGGGGGGWCWCWRSLLPQSVTGLCLLVPHSSLITVVAGSIPYMDTDTARGHENTHKQAHVVVYGFFVINSVFKVELKVIFSVKRVSFVNFDCAVVLSSWVFFFPAPRGSRCLIVRMEISLKLKSLCIHF